MTQQVELFAVQRPTAPTPRTHGADEYVLGVLPDDIRATLAAFEAVTLQSSAERSMGHLAVAHSVELQHKLSA